MLDPAIERLLCARCFYEGHRCLHNRFFPNCRQGGHGLVDHPSSSATRAGAARLLGMWP